MNETLNEPLALGLNAFSVFVGPQSTCWVTVTGAVGLASGVAILPLSVTVAPERLIDVTLSRRTSLRSAERWLPRTAV